MGRLYLAVLVAGLLVASVAGTAAASECEGFETVDGCVTVELYNELFSVEALSEQESLSFPGRSVADVYQLGGLADPPLAAADRPREFMGEPLPTIRELFQHWRVR